MIIKKQLIKKILPKRAEDSHKGTFGRVLNIAGSKQYTGAAYLSSVAALRVGAGYVTLASSEYVCKITASLTPDITFLPLKNLDELATEIEKYDVISIGCGLSQNEDASKLIHFIIPLAKSKKIPTVIDADGLNLLAVREDKELAQNFIITPHPKELARLLNITTEDIIANRQKYALIASEKFCCTVVLKGHNTLISTAENIYTNTTGCNALSKAGTGDVLTGMIAGFLAQGCCPADAAMLGVYIHGASGDLYAKTCGQYSLLVSDLLKFIPKILTKL